MPKTVMDPQFETRLPASEHAPGTRYIALNTWPEDIGAWLEAELDATPAGLRLQVCFPENVRPGGAVQGELLPPPRGTPIQATLKP